ncbi:MAG TPA: cytochrome c [Gemmataceae bacterium]|nr:cytochrome c [Gemmataceae bacterium]
MGLCLLTTACQQDMARQPYYRPLEETSFFPDGRSSRPLVDGTVPRGQLLEQSPILTYRRDSAHGDAARAVALIGNPTMNAFAALLPFTLGPKATDYVDVCPIPIDKKAMQRGQERFNIYCAVCHDALGTGNGKIVERGYLRPPNYHTDNSRGFARRGIKVHLRDLPIGYYFEVITRGFGGMPDYASQIPPEDRWKIIAYIRALQLSQWAPLKDLPELAKDKVRGVAAVEGDRP